MSSSFIDISARLSDGMPVWPGDPPARFNLLLSLERGDPCNLSQIEMGAHTGTHIDAPLHYFRGANAVDEMPLEATVGPCRVVAIHDPEKVTADELRRAHPAEGERLLLKTRNSLRRWESEPFDERFVSLPVDAAQFLAERRIRTLGVDYLSVGPWGEEGSETHRVLLGAGVWIIEGLYLGEVEPGEYELLCLPLRGLSGDGAPARAVLRKR